VVRVSPDAKANANAIGCVCFIEPEGGVYVVQFLGAVVGLHFASELQTVTRHA
jgi:hypothetical protein